MLTLLGLVMLALHYREALASWALGQAILACFGRYALYLAACLAVLLTLRAVFPISPELWRKLLHFVHTAPCCS